MTIARRLPSARLARGVESATRDIGAAFPASTPLFLPLAELVAAIHVFPNDIIDWQKALDGRDKPGHGGSGFIRIIIGRTLADAWKACGSPIHQLVGRLLGPAPTRYRFGPRLQAERHS